MSSISSINASVSASSYGHMKRPPKPDASTMTNEVFAKLDTKNQGYLTKDDLQSALGSSADSSSSSQVDALFKTMDSNEDGQISKDEMSSSLKKITEDLDSQMAYVGAQGTGGMNGMPPGQGMPPPPGDDAGLDKSQLSKMAGDASSSGNTQQASDLNSLVQSFDKADTDKDGKVSFKEAMAFKESQSGSTSSQSGNTTNTTAQSTTSQNSSVEQDGQLLQRMLDMVAKYTASYDAKLTSSLSLTA